MLNEVFTAVMMDQDDPWTVLAKQILSIFPSFNIHKTQIKKQLSTLLISRLRAEVSVMVSLSWLPLPTNWFVLQPPVNDSRECKTLNSCRGENAGLGNRQSNRLGQSCKQCPWCTSIGVANKLDELLVLLDCPSVSYERQVKSILSYIDIKSRLLYSHQRIMKDYLGGDGSNAYTMAMRSQNIHFILETWFFKIATF